jgi:hypothetical protein
MRQLVYGLMPGNLLLARLHNKLAIAMSDFGRADGRGHVSTDWPTWRFTGLPLEVQ